MIPLAELIAIEFTTPFWGALLAVAFLGETLNRRKMSAILLGLLGVLIIVRPSVGAVDPGHVIILAGAVGFAHLHRHGQVAHRDRQRRCASCSGC